MLSHFIDKNGKSLYLHLSHLAILNALKIIKEKENVEQSDL
jgi:hypothetical protein